MRHLDKLLVLALLAAGCHPAPKPVVHPPVAEPDDATIAALRLALESELAEVEAKLLDGDDADLRERRLLLVAALSAVDRAEPGLPPATWTKEQLIEAMRAQLEREGAEGLEARLDEDYGGLGLTGGGFGRRRPAKKRSKPKREASTSVAGDGLLLGPSGNESAPAEEPAYGGDDDDELVTEKDENRPAPPPEGGETDGRRGNRMAAVVQAGGGGLSPEAVAAIRRQLPRVRRCVPARTVRTRVTVRAQLYQGRLRGAAVRADPPLAPAVSGCMVEALSAFEVPGDPDAPSRVVAFPFVVDAS